MAVLRSIFVRYEELKRELVGKNPEEIAYLIEKYKEETGKILEDFNPKTIWIWVVKVNPIAKANPKKPNS